MKQTIMKRPHLFTLIGLLTLTLSCEDFDINGDLDGMWHLRSVETLSDQEIREVKSERIYYSVQQRLITVKRLTTNEVTGKGYRQYIGRFNHTGDSLILHSFVLFQIEDSIATPEELSPFYLDGTVSRYAVRQLDNKQMVLRSTERELTFKKF